MHYKAYIFDLDGTLCDTLPLCIAAFKKALRPFAGRDLSDAEIYSAFGPSEEGVIRRLFPDRYDAAIAAFFHCYRDLHDMCPAPFPGIVDLLGELRRRGVVLALVTGKGIHSAEISLERLGLAGFFADVEAGSPDGPRKPAGIAAVLSRYGLRPEEAVYIGDVVSDITAARRTGVAVYSVAWASTAKPDALAAAGPDRLFASVADFARFVLTEVAE